MKYSEGGMASIVSAVNKREDLPLYLKYICISEIFFQSNARYKNYSRTLKHVLPLKKGKYNNHGETVLLKEYIVPLMLLNGSSFDDVKRIPILSAAAGRIDVVLTTEKHYCAEFYV